MPPQPSIDTAALGRRLNSPDEAERQQAQSELRDLTAADARLLKRIGALEIGTISSCVLVSLAVMLHYMITGYRHFVNHIGSVFYVLIGATYLFSLWRGRAARHITVLDIPQAVGPLIEAFEAGSPIRSRHISRALIHLLPRLQATDAPLLTVKQRSHLFFILRMNNTWPYNRQRRYIELQLAVLRALEQVGDEKAISTVESLARSARKARVRAAAQECLSFLQLRSEETRGEQTLLRASTQTTASNVLLRASVGSLQTEPQQLLRATISEPASDAE